jgi:hypothetical protein
MPHTNIGVPSAIQDSTQLNRANELNELKIENQKLTDECRKLREDLLELLKGG